ncbi:hypothetical protein RCL1_004020 [Eukaryota sp. TZLM3-RCL]
MPHTLQASIQQFLAPPAVSALEEELVNLTRASKYCCLLVRLFLLRHPGYAHWTTKQPFWQLAFDCVQKANVAPRAAFSIVGTLEHNLYLDLINLRNSPNWPFAPLELKIGSQFLSQRSSDFSKNQAQLLVDLPLTAFFNFFKYMAEFLNCPKPSIYAALAVDLRSFPESIHWWTNSYHLLIVNQLDRLIGGNFINFCLLFREADAELTETLCIETIHSVILMNRLLESLIPNRMKRTRISILSSNVPGMVEVCKQNLQRFVSKNPGRIIYHCPWKFFHVKQARYPRWTMRTNGVSAHFTFHTRERPSMVGKRTSKDDMAKKRLNTSHVEYKAPTVKKNRKKQRKVYGASQNPQPVVQGVALEDQEPFILAIDPNHSNLCGWTAGSKSWELTSGILLSPKGRKQKPPVPVTSLTPDVYNFQNFTQYLIAVSHTWNNEANLIDQVLTESKRKVFRRVKFDFFIRKQKRFQHFWNKVKALARDKTIHVWFGNGGRNGSRQKTKSPIMRFRTYLNSRSDHFKVGDEFNTSKKVNCCKVDHEIYRRFIDGEWKSYNAFFTCPSCGILWSRDISASLNQWEIAREELLFNRRPSVFRR